MDIDYASIAFITVISILALVGIAFIFSTKIPEETEQTKDYEDSLIYPFPGGGLKNEEDNEEGDSNELDNTD